MTQPTETLQLRSTVKSSGELELALARVPLPELGAGDVLVRMEATPINPSDLGLMLSRADMTQAKAADGVITAPIPEKAMTAMAARMDVPMAIGNEGAGTVIAAGADAQELLGKTVAVLGGAMWTQYRVVPGKAALVLGADATAADGASCFVNPLTALSMVEVMRREGHTALVHTAAASNLGQMLNKICLADGVELVNVVRSPDQVKLLKDIGAKHVVDSSAPSFMADLIAAATQTGATLCFDAIGGGKLGGQILTAMEAAAVARMTTFSTYGSTTFKQLYIYGGLDVGPTELTRNFGFSWAVSGWLLTPFLQKIGPEETNKLRQRVVSELKTTFASHYTAVISLADALKPDVLAGYAKRATGSKYLINPSLDA